MVASLAPTPPDPWGPGGDAIAKSLNVLRQVSRIYGFKGEWNSDSTADHWVRMADACGGNGMKVVKYKLAAFFAFHTQQPLPLDPCPQVEDRPHQLVGGRLGRFLKLKMAQPMSVEKLSILASIKQAKKGMPRPTKGALRQKEEEFARQITTKPPSEPEGGWVSSTNLIGPVVNEDQEEPMQISRTELEKELKRTVDELFTIVVRDAKGNILERRDSALTVEERLLAVFPSTSANYIRSRKGGGAVGAILEHPNLLEGLRRPGGYESVETSPNQPRGEAVNEEHRSNEEWIVKPWIQPGYKEAYQTFWLRLLKEASVEEPLVEPVALAEALKIRVITKGPPFTQTLLESLRRRMHDTLRHHPAFQLVGKTCTEEYLLDRLGRELGPKQAFLSGDYESATDLLYSWVSETIAERVSDRLHLYPVERRKFLEALTGHLIEVKNEQGEAEIRRQTRGQLMGSRVSFPVLCIAVGCVARLACEKDQRRKIPLHDAPIAINGDDNATKCTDRGRRWWWLISHAMGLRESVGKTYFSREFVEINSTIFRYNRDSQRSFLDLRQSDRAIIRRQQPFEQVRYVNMGLLNGMKRSGGEVTLRGRQGPENDLGTRYRKLLELSPKELHGELHRVFVLQHETQLNAYGGVPWAMPTWIGGVGLIGVLEPSEKDLRIARNILLNWKQRRPRDVGARLDVPWKVWELASQRVPDPEYTSEKDSKGGRVYENLMAQMCVNLLFDSTVQLKDLHPEGEDDPTILDTKTQEKASELKKILNHNRRIWDPKGYPMGLGPPIEPRRLISQSVYPTYHRNTVSNDLTDRIREAGMD